jgi:pheromone alpha factor receptor
MAAAIFAGLQLSTSLVNVHVGSITITAVALLLPLSSLWAGLAIDHETSTLNFSSMSGYESTRGGSERGNSFPGSHINQFGRLASSNSSGPGSSTARKVSNAHLSPTSIDSRVEYVHSPERDSTELDLEAIGVRVDRSYEVRSEK